MVNLVGTVAADSTPLNTCSHTCGDKEIPYPFGINDTSSNSDCFVGGRLIQLHCNESKIYMGDNLEVSNINTTKAEIDVLFYVSEYCSVDNYTYTKVGLNSGTYTISSKENKFVTVGNSYGYFNSYSGNDIAYSTGCLTRTFGDQINDGKCSGVGCCQIDIHPKMRNVSIQASNFNTSSKFCSYSFVVRNGSYDFSSTHLSQGLPSRDYRWFLTGPLARKTAVLLLPRRMESTMGARRIAIVMTRTHILVTAMPLQSRF
ncbi:putative wall-associated receptor kinase, galacturonan-binding domain-containing protein [Medicago truncatula]|uniref:Putative wall-associated receptor kinase, galacturonan-binding domain-containing protein n=1 Tax=Medicago truncatula TaxID=3880 RepID=A0A072VED7_MEDTR|nr:wall-associated receptor kinase galacturonan-binding protein [Medicago truncatula]RHN76861.1 putative wall-associated receptor kinase, galacturonan-binding domain-containing protein [Medicago truncatula]